MARPAIELPTATPMVSELLSLVSVAMKERHAIPVMAFTQSATDKMHCAIFIHNMCSPTPLTGMRSDGGAGVDGCCGVVYCMPVQ